MTSSLAFGTLKRRERRAPLARECRCWIARILAASAIAVVALTASAVETQRVHLSGRDKDDAVPWKFMCTTGALSGFWTNLPVPSNWDVKGFGHLTYKKDYSNSITECGLYEKEFSAPKSWKDKRVFLVFEGAMTDTTAKLNEQSVGPTHHGGFYRFKYEVTDKLKLGAKNKLEVTVAKHSANESVNKAERLADYWVFGGIYRPVYLEVVPQQLIERVAIDARADGSFAMDVFVDGAMAGDAVEAQIVTLGGKKVGEVFGVPALAGSGRLKAELQTRIASPKLWTAETPNLYRVEVRLKRGKKVLHEFTERFGFRTFEVRDGDGLYLNGQKLILKGVNRHSFWPDSGRCLSEAVHRLDITTIKEMNGNAVRMSHYPPDAEFLDLCDELGLYVLDELAGWHNAYDTDIGTKLVESMVTRDVNHPSILFWDNGNEGGSNPELDRVFHEFDPQKRRVLHPWGLHSGVNTAH
ncbi:MAG TPA: glycoside hydrolase family 2 TIM barrel-domain containing protein, partial [Verrucomicrobiae bacterium]|nr:glycoside hydrolase family 2 TIM barrel-domain containing protein [Verrucomicrobiae bacterium]